MDERWPQSLQWLAAGHDDEVIIMELQGFISDFRTFSMYSEVGHNLYTSIKKSMYQAFVQLSLQAIIRCRQNVFDLAEWDNLTIQRLGFGSHSLLLLIVYICCYLKHKAAIDSGEERVDLMPKLARMNEIVRNHPSHRVTNHVTDVLTHFVDFGMDDRRLSNPTGVVAPILAFVYLISPLFYIFAYSFASFVLSYLDIINVAHMVMNSTFSWRYFREYYRSREKINRFYRWKFLQCSRNLRKRAVLCFFINIVACIFGLNQLITSLTTLDLLPLLPFAVAIVVGCALF